MANSHFKISEEGNSWWNNHNDPLNNDQLQLPPGNLKFTTMTISKSVTTAVAKITEDGRIHEPFPRPPLENIVQEWNVTGDVTWLLNFAIVGFPKCGTSTLMIYLNNSDEVQIFGEERCEMSTSQQVPLIRDLYQQLPEGDYVRGLKCPRDLEVAHVALQNYHRVFPHTDLIIGIRHPVLWFESFYNFRVQNEYNMPHPDRLIGRCKRWCKGLCTSRAMFHLYLANLNKTALSKQELKLIDPVYHRFIHTVPIQSRIFLYEVSQLNERNASRALQFRKDMQDFLHLQNILPEMIWVKPGYTHRHQRKISILNSKKIDICHANYTRIRGVLMKHSVLASRWIRRYFMQSPDVVVSSPEYFQSDILQSWEQDPCIERAAKRSRRKRRDFSNATASSDS
jgi:hypothetical protein